MVFGPTEAKSMRGQIRGSQTLKIGQNPGLSIAIWPELGWQVWPISSRLLSAIGVLHVLNDKHKLVQYLMNTLRA